MSWLVSINGTERKKKQDRKLTGGKKVKSKIAMTMFSLLQIKIPIITILVKQIGAINGFLS